MLSGLKNLPGPIVVTGHTGFKGTWLMLLLQELGVEFVGISLPAQTNSLYDRLNLRDRFKEYFLDICDFPKLEEVIKKIQPSAIIHLAAQSLVINSYAQPFETFRSNVLGTANVCQAGFEVKSINSILVATTDKVYENKGLQMKFREEDSIKGSDPYSSSKAAVESVINMWQQISISQEGPNYISMRAGNVIGGGDYAENRLLPDIIRSLFESGELRIRNPESTRPWQHVLDPIFGYLLVLSKSFEKTMPRMASFNFATTELSQSVRWALEVVNNHSYIKGRLKFSYVPNSTYESKYLDLDPSKAIQMLGWRPKWSQKEAIDRTITWWHKLLKENQDPYKLSIKEVREFLDSK